MGLVDKRVVEMVFKNKDFEAKAQQSMSTIDKLKESTNFDKVSESLGTIAQSVQKLQDRFSAFGIMGKRALENVTDTAMNMAGKLTNFLSSGVVGGGVKRAMNLENARFTMMSLYKDSDKVAEAMDNVSKSVDGTAYSLDQAALIATQFTGAGVEVGEELTNALKGLAGTAATYNADYASLGNIFASVASAGRVYGDDLLQLSTRGMPAAQVLADFFNNVAKGDESIKDVPDDIKNLTKSIAETSDKVADASNVTAGEIKELVSQGKIDFGIFSQAMYTTFGENAAKANETFSGALANIKSALGRIGAGFVEPLIIQNGPLVEMFNTIRGKINDVKKGLVFDKEANNTEALSKRATDFIIAKIETLTKKLSEIEIDKVLKVFYNGLDGVINLFKLVGDILKPIKEAFREIFPKKSIDDLVKISENFLNFTKSLKISDSTLLKVKETFKGLFALLDAGKTIVIGFVKTFGPLFLEMGRRVLSFIGDLAAGFGQFFQSVREFVNGINSSLKFPTDEITGLPKKIVGEFKDNAAFKTVLGILTAFRDGVQSILDSFRGIRRDGVKETTDGVKKDFSVFDTLLSGLESFANAIKKVFNKIGDILRPVVSWIHDIFHDALDEFKIIIAKIDSKHTTSLVLNGGLAFILTQIGQAIKNIGRSVSSGGGIGKALSGMLSNVAGVMKSAKNFMNAQALKLMADAILELVAAIFVLALIPEEEAVRGLLTLSMVVIILKRLMNDLSKMQAGILGSSQIAVLGFTLVEISAAILMAVAAIVVLAFIGYDNIVKGLFTMSAICIILSKTVKSITTIINQTSWKSILGSVVIITTIVSSIMAMVFEVVLLTMITKFLGVGPLFIAIGAIVAIAVALAISVKILTATINRISLTSVLKSVIIITAVTVAIISVATTISLLAIILGFIPAGKIEHGLLMLGGILLATIALCYILSTAFSGSSILKALKSAAIFTLLSTTLIVVAGSMMAITSILGLIPMEYLIGGLGGMALVIAAMMIFYLEMIKIGSKMKLSSLLSTIVKLTLVVGVSMALFGGLLLMAVTIGSVIAVIGSLNIMEVAGFIAAIFGIIFIGALASTKVPKFAKGLDTMAKVLVKLSKAFVLFATGSKLLLSAMIKLKNLSDKEVERISNNLNNLFEGIKEAAPTISAAIFAILGSLVKELSLFLVENLPIVVANALDAVIKSLGEIVTRIPEIVEMAVKVITSIIEALRPLLDDLINELVLLVIDLIKAVARAIDKNSGPILDAIDRLIDAIGKLIVSFIGRLFGKNQKEVQKWINNNKGILRGFVKWFGITLAGLKIVGVLKKLGSVFKVVKTIGTKLASIKFGKIGASSVTQEIASGPLAKIKAFASYFGGHGLLVAGVAAFAIVAALKFKHFVDNMDVASAKADYLTKALERQKEAYDDAYDRGAEAGLEFEDSLKGQTSEFDNADFAARTLLRSLDDYVDENGNVKESCKDLVNDGLNKLNEAYGTTYSVTEDLRLKNGYAETSYKKLREEMEKTIKLQKANSYLDTYKDEYDEALKFLNDKENAVKLTQLDELNDEIKKKYGKTYSELKSYQSELYNDFTTLDLLDRKGNLVDKWLSEMSSGKFLVDLDNGVQKVNNIWRSLEDAGIDTTKLREKMETWSKVGTGMGDDFTKAVKKARDSLESEQNDILNFLGDRAGEYDGLQESFEKYSTMVSNYENLESAILKGDAKAIDDATLALKNNLADRETASEQSLARQFATQQKYTQAELELYARKQKGIHAIDVLGSIQAQYLAWQKLNDEQKRASGMQAWQFEWGIKQWAAKAETEAKETGKSIDDILSSVTGGVTDKMADAGKNSVLGYSEGVDDNIPKVEESAAKIPETTLDTTTDLLAEASPSKLMYKYGAYAVEGFVNGLKSVGDVTEATTTMIASMLSGVQAAIDSETQPTITPIVDLSALQNGAGVVSTMLNGQRVTAANLNGKLSTQIAASINAEQFDVGIDKVVESIRHLNDNVVTLGNRVNKLQVVLDTGAMVGQLAPAMDGALGIRALRKGRGTI